MAVSNSASIMIVGAIIAAAIVSVPFLTNPEIGVTTPDIDSTIPPPQPILNDLDEVNNNSEQPVTIIETADSPKATITLSEIFEKVEPSVVSITVQKTEEDGTITQTVGSGFVFDEIGHIITNAHVIRDGEKVTVTFLDGRSYKVKIVGVDESTDVAVVLTDSNNTSLNPLVTGDSESLKVGDSVAAIGNPFGLSGSMSSGIVSQLGRLIPSDTGFLIPDVIQTDTAINPGNSGGPLLNMNGETIGINTAIQSVTGDFAGIGFAIPSQTFKKIVPILIEAGQYQHPWIGVSGVDIYPDLADVLGVDDSIGFLLITVVEDSPASKAGLQGSNQTVNVDGLDYNIGGDIILSVDGVDVRKINDILIHLQREKEVGDEMILGILRDGQMFDVTITLQPRP